MQSPSTSRIEWIDHVKGLMLLFVLIEHIGIIPSYLRVVVNVLGGMAMPCYFALSGYLFSVRKNFKTFVIGKTISLFIPYVAISLLLVLLDHNLYLGEPTSFIIDNLHRIFYEGLSANKGTPMWFVFILYIMCLFCYWLIKSRYSTYLIIGLSILFSIIAKSLHNNNLYLYLNLNSFLVAFPYFSIGILIKHYNILNKIQEILPKQILAYSSIIIFILMGIIMMSYNCGSVLHGIIPSYLFFYLYGILSITVAFITFNSFNIFRNGWSTLFTARNSMTILGFHAYIQLYWINIMQVFHASVNFIFYTTTIISLVAVFALSFLTNKYGYYIIGKPNPKTFRETLYNV